MIGGTGESIHEYLEGKISRSGLTVVLMWYGTPIDYKVGTAEGKGTLDFVCHAPVDYCATKGSRSSVVHTM